MIEAQRPTARLVSWWDTHQVSLYLGAIALGAVIGLLAPAVAPGLELAIAPVLALLLFATFLAVPLAQVGRALYDVRFLLTILAANFVVVPPIAWGLSRFVADDRGLVLGVLLVLLTPCIDYVIVFTGLAGGAQVRLLAAAPVLMLVQLLLLPLYLWLFVGRDTLSVVEIAPFVEAFLVLIAAPLAAAAVVQQAAGHQRSARAGRAVESTMATAMVPLMIATLAVVVGSQVAAVGSEIVELSRVIPLYVAFVVAAVATGVVLARTARLGVAESRAVVFSTTTRNSLVVLPLALVVPGAIPLVPAIIVTQTLIELLAELVYIRGIHRLGRRSA